jgi:glycogen operon protein
MAWRETSPTRLEPAIAQPGVQRGRPGRDLSFYIIFSAYWELLEFQLPAERHIAGEPWRRWIDSSLESPDDIQDWPAAPVVTGQTYLAGPRSVVVLIAAADKTARGSLS